MKTPCAVCTGSKREPSLTAMPANAPQGNLLLKKGLNSRCTFWRRRNTCIFSHAVSRRSWCFLYMRFVTGSIFFRGTAAECFQLDERSLQPCGHVIPELPCAFCEAVCPHQVCGTPKTGAGVMNSWIDLMSIYMCPFLGCSRVFRGNRVKQTPAIRHLRLLQLPLLGVPVEGGAGQELIEDKQNVVGTVNAVIASYRLCR